MASYLVRNLNWNPIRAVVSRSLIPKLQSSAPVFYELEGTPADAYFRKVCDRGNHELPRFLKDN